MSNATTTYSAEQIQAIGGKPWEGRDGRYRVYLNDIAGLAGLEVQRYNTGNICSARLDGQPISNNKAHKFEREFDDSKLWWENGEIVARNVPYEEDVRAEIARRVAALTD